MPNRLQLVLLCGLAAFFAELVDAGKTTPASPASACSESDGLSLLQSDLVMSRSLAPSSEEGQASGHALSKDALKEKVVAAASGLQPGPAPLMKSEAHRGRHPMVLLQGLADLDDAANVALSSGRNSSSLENNWDNARNLHDTWVGALALAVNAVIIFVFVNYAQVMPEKAAKKQKGEAQQFYIGEAEHCKATADVSHAPEEGCGPLGGLAELWEDAVEDAGTGVVGDNGPSSTLNEAPADVSSSKADPELPRPDSTDGAEGVEPLRALARALTEALEPPEVDSHPANQHVRALAAAHRWDVRRLRAEGPPTRKLSED